MMLNIPGVVTCITGSLRIDVHRKLYHLSFSQSDLKDVSLFITDCIRFNLPLCFCQHPFAAEFVSDMVLKASQETPIEKNERGMIWCNKRKYLLLSILENWKKYQKHGKKIFYYCLSMEIAMKNFC